MSTTGFNPFVIGGHGNPPNGSLKLDYAMDGNNNITSASFTYSNVGQDQSYPVTFTAPVSGVYTGTSTMQPPLNIPGQRAFKSGVFVFTPVPDPFTLTGTFSSTNQHIVPGDDVPWEADSTTGNAKPKAAVSGKY